ncbi:unnamed protein product [Rhodiola kirilowii]
MAVAVSVPLVRDWVVHSDRVRSNHRKQGNIKCGHPYCSRIPQSKYALDAWRLPLLNGKNRAKTLAPSRCKVFLCRSVLNSSGGNGVPLLKSAAFVLERSYSAIQGSPLALRLIPAVGVIVFSTWGLAPVLRLIRIVFFRKNDNSWKKSSTHHIMSSYIQPILLWTGVTLICRAFDPLNLSSEASQAVKRRLLTFVRSLSTVLAFAYCLSSLIQQSQKYFMETNESSGANNMGLQFAGKAMYTGVWVAAVSLFMELLGFSTQKWLTAGGLGTVLLTLAGREIFTNFLSSVMIHATRPFVLNEWIQTKIDGSEVSGIVEHVGWWSPTIIRGDDREAIHIPNHKFTVNVVRNLTQRSHWRIKNYLAISHLDVNKINNIVADMRKVLAKNPQVEQQRLHRRVFLETVNPENQALMILISCFVKTSHFEEYLRVKEAILMDLLRIVSHHRARLATPIRTVHNVYGEADLDMPYSETNFSRRPVVNRPYLLIEPSYKTSDDKTKPSSRQSSIEKDVNIEAPSTPKSKAEPGTSTSNHINESAVDDKVLEKVVATEADVAVQRDSSKQKQASDITQQLESKSREKLNSSPSPPQSQQDTVKPVAPTSRPPLEENIVLGVALEGSRRTLPIQEEPNPSHVTHEESMEMATARNTIASVKDKNDSQPPVSPTSATGNQDML